MIAMQYGNGNANKGRSLFTLLWENDTPSSSFAAQSISVNLAGYRFFGVVIQYATGTTDNPMMQIFEVDEIRKILTISPTTQNRVGGRHVTYDATNHTLTFDGAYFNGSANNTYAIPLRIYGISV